MEVWSPIHLRARQFSQPRPVDRNRRVLLGQPFLQWTHLFARVVRGLLAGGALMGWRAMTGLGCTVGVLLSGTHAGAVSGWFFLVFRMLGGAGGLRSIRLFAAR